jgi:fatty acid desaturase
MSEVTATDAQSSGVVFDERQLKSLARRSDVPGLRHLGLWILMLIGSGWLLHLSLGGAAVIPAMALFGTALTVPAYSLSHACSHGTAFRTGWLNECALWLTSLIYMEGPMMRRYAHARHHSYTWMKGKDAQMPFGTPLTPKGWLLHLSLGDAAVIPAMALFGTALTVPAYSLSHECSHAPPSARVG